MKRYIFAMCFILNCFAISANEIISDDNFKYEVIDDENVAVVSYIGSLTSPSIPAIVEEYVVAEVREGTFVGKSKVISIEIKKDNSVQTALRIHPNAFDGANLTEIIIRRDIESMGEISPWANHPNIETAHIRGANLTKEMLADCSQIIRVNLFSPVTNIEDGAFADCSSLERLWCQHATPLSVTDATFDGIDLNKCVLQVPEDAIATYRATDYWGEFRTISGDSEDTVVDVLTDVKVTLNPSDAQVLNVGETLQLSAIVTEEDETVGDAVVTWNSSAEDVASVDESGLVSAHAAGTATITAAYATDSRTVKSSIEIEVLQPAETENIALILKMPAGTIELPEASLRPTPLRIVAESGYLINSVLLDDREITTELDGEGRYTVAQLAKSATLTVVYVQAPVSSVGGDINTNNIKVCVYNGEISVKGVTQGDVVELYDINGRLLYSTTDHTLFTSYRGPAILIVGNQVFKFSL